MDHSRQVYSENPEKKCHWLLNSVFILVLVCLAVVLILALKVNDDLYTNYLESNKSNSTLGIYKKAAVSSDGYECAKIGKYILKRGGNAVDSAISTLLCVGVVLPESMGLGGGFFMTFYNRSSRKTMIIDARETAPSKASIYMFKANETLSSTGGLSIAVPGELAGYWKAHQLYGSLPWTTLFDGPIQVCKNGFKVGRHLASALLSARNSPGIKNSFTNPLTKELYKENDLLKRPDLALTYEKLAREGPDIFYNGSMGKGIVDEISKAGGIITMDDMRSYTPRVYEALEMSIENRKLKILTPNLPSSGVLFSFILKIMAKFSYCCDGSSLERASLFFHHLIETYKHSYSRRMLLGDDKFDDVDEVMRNLTSDTYADDIYKSIKDYKTFPSSYYGEVFSKLDHGTAHISVMDEDGNAVAVGSTINRLFGCKLISKSTGIIFNNEMDDFSSPNITNSFGVPASNYNLIKPGKRPLSSMCPAILVDSITGEVKLVIGASGGTEITTSSSYAAIRHLFLGENVKEAIDAPRVHNQLFPNLVEYESTLSNEIIRNLRIYGHETVEGSQSVVMAISKSNENIQANADYRRSGSVDGF